jgi:chemotaxis protein MotB
MARKRDRNAKGDIIIRREEVVEGEGHGGAWKVAYADFVTAMMAFFLLMWLLNATTEDQRKGLADYFSPNSVMSHNSSGTGQPFGGKTAFSEGAMVSDRGAVEANVGERPVVDPADPDQSDVVAQPQPHRDDVESKAPDQGGRMAAQPQPVPAHVISVVRTAKPGEAAAGDAGGKKPTDAELRAEQERREKQAFEQAAQQIREAVSADPQLAELARQLQIDITPDGLRIQILDADHEAMFPLGSAVPNDHARLLLQKIAPVLTKMPEDVSLAGHTDAAPFAGPGRTNWELSADRANATRRLLEDSGLVGSRIRSVTGNAERDLLVPSDPLAAANRRISILVLRAVPLSAKAPP